MLSLADIVVIDVQCDYTKNELGNVKNGHVDMAALEEAFEIIASKIQPETLVLTEQTVSPGTTEQVAFPLMKKIFVKRGILSDPLLAHSYERVMPGKDYVSSIRDFWRVCSGVNERAKEKVVKFLNEVINTAKYPLTVLDRPIESETAKIVENSYRATILAFMHEWSLFAERNGVDITKVINAVRVRPTHSNLMLPGPGIGGYCLPKDGGLGIWSYKHILGFEDDIFEITPKAIDINDTRSLHAGQLVRDALRNMDTPIAGAEILILGASYREDVGDTRYSGSEVLVRKLAEMGAEIKVHDPYVDHWYEFENQEVYPNNSKHVYFRNQKKLNELKVQKDLGQALKQIDALVLAVKHKAYIDLDPVEIIRTVGKPIAVIDCYGVLSDEQISAYLSQGCEVKGLGRATASPRSQNVPTACASISNAPSPATSTSLSAPTDCTPPCAASPSAPKRRSNTISAAWSRAFVVDGYQARDELVYVTHNLPGRQVGRFSLRGNRTMFLFIVRSDHVGDVGDVTQVRRCCVASSATPDGNAHRSSPSSTTSTTCTLMWSARSGCPGGHGGRVALVGDAAACVSLLAGEGTGLAMAEAYVLAGELARAGADHRRAFDAYETRLRPFIESKQASAEKFLSFFVDQDPVGHLVPQPRRCGP